MKQARLILLLVIFAGLIGTSSGLRIVSSGNHLASSSSYRLVGIIRDRQLNLISNTRNILGEGFLRTIAFFRPVLAPIVTAITPDRGPNTGPLDIAEVSGANFTAGAAVKLSQTGQADIVATRVVVNSGGKIACTFDLTGAAGGLWAVTVTNPDGRSGTLPAAFRITYPAPVITLITPSRGDNTGRIGVVINGEHFRSGATAALLKTGERDILGESMAVSAATRLSCAFDLTSKAVGVWDVRVTNDDGQTATLPAAFTVQAPGLAISGPVGFASYSDPGAPAIKGASISYNLTRDARLTVHIYNMRGERVWSQVYPAGSAGGQAGANTVLWNGLTSFNNIAGEGVYLVHFVGQVDGQEKILAREKLGIVK
ncbi:MAG: hypothetical protein MUC35_00025 [Candidatus Margulisbacteria bacterium]|jgi:hypothetical protein|nr:hypothetical protein [Candidatus Margulisiibacteriota bacterium]